MQIAYQLIEKLFVELIPQKAEYPANCAALIHFAATSPFP